MPYKNKADQAAAARRHYEQNKEKMKARAVAHKARQREIIVAHIRSVKDVPCMDCHQRYPHYVMDFDHTSDDKAFSIADFNRLGKTLAKVIAEIAKCDILCANCHRERTWMRLRAG